MARLSFSDAIREAYATAMRTDPSVVLVGVGLTDSEAVFGTLTGLYSEFGPDRIVEGPLAEQMLTGLAFGASLMGLRPVLIHRRVDWLPVAMDQLVSCWAKWHFMFGGQQKVPSVVRGIVGRGWGNGPQHTQSLQGLCASVPGLTVVVPATPADAKGLTLAAIFSDDPVVFIDHRSSHRMVDDVPSGDYRVPIGRAEVMRPGRDVTIVAVGPMVIEALRASRVLEHREVSCEVINLRTVRPIDFDTVIASVSRTGRLLVADCDWPHYGVASTIVSETAQHAFAYLKRAPATVTWPDHPVLASHGVEGRYYPGAHDIVTAVCAQMGIGVGSHARTALAPEAVQSRDAVSSPF